MLFVISETMATDFGPYCDDGMSMIARVPNGLLQALITEQRQPAERKISDLLSAACDMSL